MTRYNSIGTEIGVFVDGSPDTFTPYGQIQSVDGFETVAADLDFSETTDAWDVHQSGAKSISPISFVLHYSATTHSTLRDSIGATASFYIKFSDTSKVTFAGYLSSFKPTAGDNKGKLVANCTVQPSGAPTWVAPA